MADRITSESTLAYKRLRIARESQDMHDLPVLDKPSERPRRRLPPWLKRPLPAGSVFGYTKQVVDHSGVATVCSEARCPNVTECWAKKHAAFMILGDRCTRRCSFCAVATAKPAPPATDEPQRLAEAVDRLGLSHVVITAVARDDLADEGAAHFARCVEAIHERRRATTVEVLPADFHARLECIQTLCAVGPEIYNHNIETVERLTRSVRPQAKYDRSLEVLRVVKEIAGHIITKSGIMLGLGETGEEVMRTLADLRGVGCDVLTIGQYLQPTTTGHAPVQRFYTPQEFVELGEAARELGFISVASGPFVRSSYNAGEVFDEARRRVLAMGSR